MTSTSGAGASHATDDSGSVEPTSKRIKLEPPVLGAVPQAAAMNPPDALVPPPPVPATAFAGSVGELKPNSERVTVSKGEVGESELVTCSDNSNTSGSHTSLHDNNLPAMTPAISSVPHPNTTSVLAVPPPPPAKASTMMDLKMKYLDELEYMLREFRKLERQLLGAKGAAKLEESAGSRERREKLHSFILHLEETVQQIEEGCTLEAEKDASGVTAQRDEATRTEDEENVQRLEEHILTNLLPVKIRLKKQLAAQQGATRNPPGMPAPRRGSLQPTNLGKGTFAAAAEERRKQAEEAQLAAQERELAIKRASDSSQFGKPLGGGGSSLTQKLHGATLGSKHRTHGHGVGSATSTSSTIDEAASQTPKILYAGMVPQSTQHKSSLNAASGAHDLVVQDSNFMESGPDIGEADSTPAPLMFSVAPTTSETDQQVPVAPKTRGSQPNFTPTMKEDTLPFHSPEGVEIGKNPHDDISMSEDERRKLRKKRRRRKLMRLANRREKERQLQVAAQQAQAAQGAIKPVAGRKKSTAPKPPGKKGPKSVEYMCALCSETYTSTCDYNPWWALAQHECPKCRKMQIPRIDISAPANAIDYHPALLAHADDNNGGGSSPAAVAGPAPTVQVVHIAQPPVGFTGSSGKDHMFVDGLDSDSGSELSELSDDSLSDDSLESDDDDEESLDFQAMSQAEQAEHESFGEEYTGPVLSEEDASRMLVVMAHASTCPCHHKLTKHREVCKSTKFMMLHVRDCPGTTASFDVCPFPWCRKVKHLLYHLVSCAAPESCGICSPRRLSESLKNLSGLNVYRAKKHRQRMIAALKSRNAAAKAKGALAPDVGPVAQRTGPKKVSDAAKPARVRAPSVGRAAVPATAVTAVTLPKEKAQTQAGEKPISGAKLTKAIVPGMPSPPVQPAAPPLLSGAARPIATPKPMPTDATATPGDGSRDSKTGTGSQLVDQTSEITSTPSDESVPASKLVPGFTTSVCSPDEGIDGPKAAISLASSLQAKEEPTHPAALAAFSVLLPRGPKSPSIDSSRPVSTEISIEPPADSYIKTEPSDSVLPAPGVASASGSLSVVGAHTQQTPAMECSVADFALESAEVPPGIMESADLMPHSEKPEQTDLAQPIEGPEASRMNVKNENASAKIADDEANDEVPISKAMTSHSSSGALKIAC